MIEYLPIIHTLKSRISKRLKTTCNYTESILFHFKYTFTPPKRRRKMKLEKKYEFIPPRNRSNLGIVHPESRRWNMQFAGVTVSVFFFHHVHIYPGGSTKFICLELVIFWGRYTTVSFVEHFQPKIWNFTGLWGHLCVWIGDENME